MEELRVETGTLLAALPNLVDPNFMHSVVLICQHAEPGAYGLVVNRRTEHTVRELLPDHPTLGKVDEAIWLGGPVDPTSLQFVHRVPDQVAGGHPLGLGLFLGGNLESLGRYLLENPDSARDHVRIFIGYSGWSPGQLEGELRLGSWLPAPPALDAVFGRDTAATWRQVVRSVGGASRGLEDLPPDVSWN